MIYLGFDLGLANTGVAISYEGKISQPLESFKVGNLTEQIINLAKHHQADHLVIGCPPSGPIKQLAEQTKQSLQEADFKVSLQDEDFSSKQSLKMMVEANTSQKKRSLISHSASAAYILQNFLDLLQ